MRSHCIMHVPFEGPGHVEEWLSEKTFPLKIWPLNENPVLPDPDDVDFLIVMGGPMNIYEYEKYPWLSAEKSFLRTCIEPVACRCSRKGMLPRTCERDWMVPRNP